MTFYDVPAIVPMQAPEPRHRIEATRCSRSLAERVAELRDLGLVALGDPLLDAVLADCPSCRASSSDPLGLYRPLTWGTTGSVYCSACGFAGCWS